ncbi:nucleoside/nucleotide kinase family protein [Nocardia sp. CDC159]|uniref:Nucleoside/nucleotide kinase family protein n=1 Tax=Nocardia pulmonis TaxID=2951408 RepID=A0A9X2E346_9NOCA|nr:MULTISPECIES: nucleoside/nucleotide kinase family protein [Nocardia]MCM6772790.1 nucleoside/nucleotide kinase family protein [Nocardia pulmonis]MCM6785907.1 nucleoside/nucleotide kinase family protein [Nocardia sp. CDC159]
MFGSGDEVSLGELADHVRERAAGRVGRFVLGIAGPPGAGKSTFAGALRDAIGAGTAEVAPMDGFHLTNAELRVAGALARKGEPDTFDVGGYLDRLRALREMPLGQRVSWPIYDRKRHEPVPDGVVFDRQAIAITEGNYLLLDDYGPAGWSAVREYLDEVWYLDAAVGELRERLLRRHIRGGKSEEFARAKVAGSDLMNAELVAATRGRADLVLRSNGTVYLVD